MCLNTRIHIHIHMSVNMDPATPVNGYAGYTLESSGVAVDRIALSDDTDFPKFFFDHYVKERRPCIFVKPPADETQRLDSTYNWAEKLQNLTPAALCAVAGEAVVKVEKRCNNKQRQGGGGGRAFGNGVHATMKVSALAKALAEGCGDLYMTTQDLAVDDEGRPALMSSPCTELYQSNTFPLVPPCMGQLLPMNVNLWWGRAAAGTLTPDAKDNKGGGGGSTEGEGEGGTSSGLHHDFHDNLYVLIKGRKQFLLFSPADALNLHTSGTIAKVHPNGRVNYFAQRGGDSSSGSSSGSSGSGGSDSNSNNDLNLTHADGSVEAARQAMRADLAVAKAQQRLEEVVAMSGDEAAISEAEEQLEEALGLALEAETTQEAGDDYKEEDAEDYGEEEEEDDDDDGEVEEEEEEDDDDDDDGEVEEVNGLFASKRKRARTASTMPSSRASATAAAAAPAFTSMQEEGSGDGGDGGGNSSLPANFSLIEGARDDAAKATKEWPSLSKTTSTLATLDEGEMLYLPCGWFHEVFSMSRTAKKTMETNATTATNAVSASVPRNGDGVSGSGCGVSSGSDHYHQAFNYWFHPPDTLHFEAPYSSNFWKWDFEQRPEAMAEAAVRAAHP